MMMNKLDEISNVSVAVVPQLAANWIYHFGELLKLTKGMSNMGQAQTDSWSKHSLHKRFGHFK